MLRGLVRSSFVGNNLYGPLTKDCNIDGIAAPSYAENALYNEDNNGMISMWFYVDQKFPDPYKVYTQTLKALFDCLISQSQTHNFYKTTSGSAQSAITGLFQCRGDLGTKDCLNCVNKLPETSNKVCGKKIAARVQLSGCYLRYEMEWFRTVSGTEMLYKFCGSRQVSERGFVEKSETAFHLD
ncbi:Gnk2-homologous domain [Dillenia turbinata]|uniref:Gnk2-homologous domain n=1 Tax=Dillenia turbinata TaxID=194707 RepID=A0AAN8VFJ0_9MAGN